MVKNVIMIILSSGIIFGQSQILTVGKLVEILQLEPHPTANFFYKSTYKSDGIIPKTALPEKYSGDRSYFTVIYSLLPKDTKLGFRKLLSDEVLHFYMGGPLTIVQITPDGKVEEIELGEDISNGQQFQHIIPAGYWFGIYNSKGSEYTLYGANVIPGFEYEDYLIGQKEELLKQFPDAKDIINFLME